MQDNVILNQGNNQAMIQNVCFGILLDFSSKSSAFLLLKPKSCAVFQTPPAMLLGYFC